MVVVSTPCLALASSSFDWISLNFEIASLCAGAEAARSAATQGSAQTISAIVSGCLRLIGAEYKGGVHYFAASRPPLQCRVQAATGSLGSSGASAVSGVSEGSLAAGAAPFPLASTFSESAAQPSRSRYSVACMRLTT